MTQLEIRQIAVAMYEAAAVKIIARFDICPFDRLAPNTRDIFMLAAKECVEALEDGA